MVINRSFELAPWADALYAVDRNFWAYYPAAREFAGLKIGGDDACARFPELARVRVAFDGLYPSDAPQRGPVGTVGGGGNSGFQALNLAAQFGASRILLAGFDFLLSHWHADHVAPCRNPKASTLAEWRETLDEAAPVYRAWGVDVVNCSPVSTLTAFRRATIREALEEHVAA